MSNITKECRITVTGDVTAANSQAINAILSWCIIARQGFQGGNRDKILEDLMYTPPGQMKKFRAEITLFAGDKCHMIIRQLFAAYFECTKRVRHATTSSVMQSTIATFSALFYDHTEFASKATAATFLATAQSGENDVIVDTLCFWTDELLTSGVRIRSFITVDPPLF
ncbi:hypothetical protein LTR49_028288 [Elasticomyces elasticus]|nr:hypothetical protein LTR49_028288 [Elasticomyces elasticus]